MSVIWPVPQDLPYFPIRHFDLDHLLNWIFSYDNLLILESVPGSFRINTLSGHNKKENNT